MYKFYRSLKMELLNIEETAEKLRIKKSTIYSWVHQKKIPHIKLNGKLCFETEALKHFIESGKVA
jgi:excisionase family DNA binding protein